MSRRPLCFVICPIGSKGSDVRTLSDDVFDLIIQPAVEKFDIQLIRADKISSVGSITSEIVEHVQKADLCIIDTTGHNPNVMYECGRRHETGKPYIMIAQEGETLPFDINTIRTIFYTLNTPREIRNVIVAIQDVTSKLMAQGFNPSNAGDSLSSLSEAVIRIERTLNAVLSISSVPGAQKNLQLGSVSQVLKNLSPAEAVNYAIEQQDLELVNQLIPLVRSRIEENYFTTYLLPQAIHAGSRISWELLDNEIGKIQSYPISDQIFMLSGYVAGVEQFGDANNALLRLAPFLEALQTEDTYLKASIDDRASFLNMKLRLLHHAARYEEAAAVGEFAIQLAPEAAFLYANLSRTYEQLKRSDKVLEMVDRLMSRPLAPGQSHSATHLARAVQVYSLAGDREKARVAFLQLQQVSPMKATVLMGRPDLAQVLQA